MSKARDLADSYTDSEVDSDVINAKAGRKNLIINGAMQVAQRGTSLASPQNYTLDRWRSLRYAAGNYTVSQQLSGHDDFKYCIRLQRNSGDTSGTAIAINQPVEQSSCYALKGKKVTVSFWVRNGSDFSASVYKLAVSSTTSTTDIGMYYDNFTANNAVLSLVAIQPSTNWVKYTHTVTIPEAANQIGFSVISDIYSGTAGTNDYYEITGVQIELGSQATDFEYRSYGEELALCQRYYQNLHFVTHPVNTYINTNNAYTSFPLVKEMREIPTVTFDTSVANGGFVHNRNTSYSITTAIAATAFSKSCINARFDVVSGFSGDAGHVYIGVKVDAEL